jgi:RNA polymerase sigma factor (sigma-70 family)
MTAALESAIKALQPIVRREAQRLKRKVPDSVTTDDLEAAGLEGAWQAARDFNGDGNLEAFASERIKQRMLDYLRKTHPAGRSGKKIVATAGDDELALLVAEDDPAAEVQRAQDFDVQMDKFTPERRAAIQRTLAGKPGGSVSAAKVTALLDGKKAAAPSNYDPQAVPIRMGVVVPPNAGAFKRPNRAALLLARMPAGGSVLLTHAAASTLVKTMRAEKVRYATHKRSETLTEVWREPTAEQLNQRGKHV